MVEAGMLEVGMVEAGSAPRTSRSSFEVVRSAAGVLCTELSCFDAERFSGEECAYLAEELSRAEKACAAARLLAAARAVACDAHRRRGVADPASWLARQGGTTPGAERRALMSVKDLFVSDETKVALLGGEVSLSQAEEIVRTERVVPGAAHELLALARETDLSTLRAAARSKRLSNLDPETLHRRQHRARKLRHFVDDLGMTRIDAALPPEDGVPLLSRLEEIARRLRRTTRSHDGAPEPFEASLADALCLALSGAQGAGTLVALGGRECAPVGPGLPALPDGALRSPTNWRADLVIVCDLRAYRRGHAHEDEPCHIVRGGPIPVSLVRMLSADAFVKAVLHDGVEIHSIAHFGRHIPATLRSALDLGCPPDFPGASCVDCGRRSGLEYDHVDPVVNLGETSYQNLVARCWADHRSKTERDRLSGRLGPRAAREAKAAREKKSANEPGAAHQQRGARPAGSDLSSAHGPGPPPPAA